MDAVFKGRLEDFIAQPIHAHRNIKNVAKLLHNYKNQIWSICQQTACELPKQSVTVLNHMGKPTRYYSKRTLPRLASTSARFNSKFDLRLG